MASVLRVSMFFSGEGGEAVSCSGVMFPGYKRSAGRLPSAISNGDTPPKVTMEFLASDACLKS